MVDWPADEVEIIVQDGGSTDGTLDALQRYGDRLKVFSERDGGQTDALNKGIQRASGQYIGWLNADDLYVPEMWSLVEPVLRSQESPDAVFGDYAITFGNGDVMRRIVLSDRDWPSFLASGFPLWSGSTLWNRRVFESFGTFDESLHYCMDVEFYLRVAGRISTKYVPHELGHFRIHEGSKTGSQPWAFFREQRRVRRRHAEPDMVSRVRESLLDAKYIFYFGTKRIRESRLYARVRKSHRY